MEKDDLWILFYKPSYHSARVAFLKIIFNSVFVSIKCLVPLDMVLNKHTLRRNVDIVNFMSISDPRRGAKVVMQAK